MAAQTYTQAKVLLAQDRLKWSAPGEVFRALLVGVSYAFNPAQRTVADIIAAEVSGGTYARVTVTGRAVIADWTGDRALLDADNIVFPALGGVTPKGLVIYKRVGADDQTPGDDPLICYLGFGLTPTNGQSFMVELHPDGAIAISTC